MAVETVAIAVAANEGKAKAVAVQIVIARAAAKNVTIAAVRRFAYFKISVPSRKR
ncbi:MAG: hypothetical protein K1X64_05440 [Myxococcaceae bacterium]|nr:hypothetical protein [Myxococcaceae bacterium]